MNSIVNLKAEHFKVIDQTGETVFHRDIQTPRRELKIRRAEEYFSDEIRGVWIADETLSEVNGSKRRSKIIKIYAN